MVHKIDINSKAKSQMIEVTQQVTEVIIEEKARDGVAIVYCPHTTAGITINENADPDVAEDLLMRLDEVYPWLHPKYRHVEGNSAAHLKASTVGASQSIPITDGKLILGTWQGIYFCEFDGPRNRSFYVKVIK